MKTCRLCPLSSEITGEPLELENSSSPYLFVFDAPSAQDNLCGGYLQGLAGDFFSKGGIDLSLFSRTSLLKCSTNERIPKYFKKCKLHLWNDILAVNPSHIFCWGETACTTLGKKKRGWKLKPNLFTEETVVLGHITTTVIFFPNIHICLLSTKTGEKAIAYLKEFLNARQLV